MTGMGKKLHEACAAENLADIGGCETLPIADRQQFDKIAATFLNAVRSEGSAVPLVEGWLPIESAPRDGTKVLIVTVEGDGFTAYDIVRWIQDTPKRGFWSGKRNAYVPGPGARRIKGWTPLPAPPAVSGADHV